MSILSFSQKLQVQFDLNRFLCVGLDPDLAKMPSSVAGANTQQKLFNFAKAIVDATSDVAAAFKPNTAFYEGYGAEGILALVETIAYIKKQLPKTPVILDAKRADIGNTNFGYLKFAYDVCEADAITVHPYLGGESLLPFLERADKGVIVMCRNSNPGSEEFQMLQVEGKPLYQTVAERVSRHWNKNQNCGLVVGATYPQELAEVRRIAPNLLLLIPGIGAQGGDLASVMAVACDAKGQGILVNASRSILYASDGADFAQASQKEARLLHDEILRHRRPS